jgi:hypothetical protein
MLLYMGVKLGSSQKRDAQTKNFREQGAKEHIKEGSTIMNVCALD